MKSWTLKNNAQLFYEPKALPHLSSIHIVIERGSFKEPIHGLAHLVEHATAITSGFAFDSSATEKSGDVLEHFNASTSLTETSYSLGALNEDFTRLSTKLLDDVFVTPLSDAGITHDKDVIARELIEQRPQETPIQIATKKFISTYFGSTWYEYDGIGTKKSVLGTPNDAVHAFRREANVPANAKIFIAGQVRRADFEMIFDKIESYTKSPASDVGKVPFSLPTKPITLDSRIPINAELAYLQIAFEKPNVIMTDGLAYGVIAQTLFSGDGRLMTLFREKLRASYDIQSSPINFVDATGQYLRIPCHPDNVEQTRTLLFEEFVKVSSQGLRDSELARIQKRLKIDSLSERSSSNWDVIKNMAGAVKYGADTKQYLAAMGRIRNDEIIHTARRYLPTQDSPYVMQVIRHSE